MKIASLLLLCLIFGSAICQNCDLQGPFVCSGGDIGGIDFGDDEDDDFFEYFLSNSDASCSVIQEGTYEIDGETITVQLDSDDCTVTGDGDCDCIETLEFTSSNNCGTILGPNGETCEPSNSKFLFPFLEVGKFINYFFSL